MRRSSVSLLPAALAIALVLMFGSARADTAAGDHSATVVRAAH